MHRSGFILVALLSTQAGAATISKCEDAAGNVTFTKNANCPEATSLKGHVDAKNQRISSEGETVKIGQPKAYQPRTVQRPHVVVREVPVVVEREPEEDDTYRGPKRTARKLRTVGGGPRQIETRDVNITSNRRTKDGRVITTTEKVTIPIVR